VCLIINDNVRKPKIVEIEIDGEKRIVYVGYKSVWHERLSTRIQSTCFYYIWNTGWNQSGRTLATKPLSHESMVDNTVDEGFHFYTDLEDCESETATLESMMMKCFVLPEDVIAFGYNPALIHGELSLGFAATKCYVEKLP